MDFKKFFLIFLFAFLLFPTSKINAQTSNSGFVPSNIWYSKDPFEEGDKIQIYTLVFNGDNRELSGVVFFFDKDVILGKKTFAVPAKSAQTISINWTATAGDHKIYGKIENARFLISPDKYEDVYLADNQTIESSHTVNKKILSKSASTSPNPTGILDNVTGAINPIVQDAEKLIDFKTPDAISKPVTSTSNLLEGLRSSISKASNDKKDVVKNEIKTLYKATPNEEAKNSKLLKPFKYIELFFLNIFSFIFNNKIIFYVILLISLGFIIRVIWRSFF